MVPNCCRRNTTYVIIIFIIFGVSFVTSSVSNESIFVQKCNVLNTALLCEGAVCIYFDIPDVLYYFALFCCVKILELIISVMNNTPATAGFVCVYSQL